MDGIKKYKFKVAIPLSVNHIYAICSKTRNGRPLPRPFMYMLKHARELKEIMKLEFISQGNKQQCPRFKEQKIIGEITVYNLRANADTNNLHKLTWDALEEAGIIDDDKNIIERTIDRKKTPDKEKYIVVEIYLMQGKPSFEDIMKYFPWINPL